MQSSCLARGLERTTGVDEASRCQAHLASERQTATLTMRRHASCDRESRIALLRPKAGSIQRCDPPQRFGTPIAC